jgi:uncharacterized glyoxalase superfamily protein PhnB
MMSESDDEVRAAYDVLVVGATIIEPMRSTTFSSCTVTLIDKFGIPWQRDDTFHSLILMSILSNEFEDRIN